MFFWYQATRMARASASCRYRMAHFAECLRGATTVVDPRPSSRVFRRAEVVIVVRPLLDTQHKRLIASLRHQGVRMIADFDDLLFSGSPAEYPLVLTGAWSEQDCATRLAGYREGLSHFDAFTVSTEALRAELLAVVPGADVACIPNGLSRGWVEQGRALYPAWRPADRKVMRYFCGSPSHDADFAVIAPMLGELLRCRRDVTLEIVGPLQLDVSTVPAGRVRRLPRVPYMELPRLLASSWLALAPLAPTRFNACKSAIKLLEAAAFGVPCIGSPNSDMARHAPGSGAILAETEEEWWTAIERLRDHDHRMRASQQARYHVDSQGLAVRGAAALSGLIRR